MNPNEALEKLSKLIDQWEELADLYWENKSNLPEQLVRAEAARLKRCAEQLRTPYNALIIGLANGTLKLD